ncbi:MAG: hypothetical protein AB9895_00930 [Negativicutes bacterium]
MTSLFMHRLGMQVARSRLDYIADCPNPGEEGNIVSIKTAAAVISYKWLLLLLTKELLLYVQHH